MAEARIEWEAALDTWIHSYSFSFIDYRNEMEGDIVHQDMLRLLERAGFYHVAEFKTFHDELPSEIVQSVILPPENTDLDAFKEACNWAFTDSEIAQRFTGISLSMHAWYGTPLLSYGWDELRKRLDYLNDYQDLWRCNHNAFAAYRYQYQHGSIELLKQEGAVVCLRIHRPRLTFLNDPIPITIGIKNVHSSAIMNITCDTAAISPASIERAEMVMYQIAHDRDQFLPDRIGRIQNTTNRTVVLTTDVDPDFPDIRALLYQEEGQIVVKIQNHTHQELKHLHIQYRLPLQYEEGIRRMDVPSIAAGAHWQDAFTPTWADVDAKYRQGDVYLVAQIDFMHADTGGRIYLECTIPQDSDASFPRDHFACLGPISPEQFDLNHFLSEVKVLGHAPDTWQLSNGSILPWRAAQYDGYIEQSVLDVELIRTQGDWYKLHSPVYILHSIVMSSVQQPVEFLCYRDDILVMILNGEQVNDFESMLLEGENELVLVYHPRNPAKPSRNSACFLRLVNPETEKRLDRIAYCMPDNIHEGDGILRIALLQMLPDSNNQQENMAIAAQWCRKAAAAHADIALFPEMFNIGYTPFHGTDETTIQEWKDQSVNIQSEWIQHFRKLAHELDMAIAVTQLHEQPLAPLNALTLIDRHGDIRFTYGKVHICDFGFESVCASGDAFHVAALDTQHGPVEIGAMICYDREFPESARILMLKGAEIILTPNACPLDDVRLNQFQARAVENAVAVFMTNYPAPMHNGRSVAYGPSGEQLALAGSEEELCIASIHLHELRDLRARTIWGDAYRRPQYYSPLLNTEPLPVFKRNTMLGVPVNRHSTTERNDSTMKP